MAIVAVANAEDATETTTFGKDGIATSSLGIHYEETGFSSVEVRPDGGLFAQREEEVMAYLPSGAPDPAAPPQRVPRYRKVFPVAGGKSLVLVNYRLTRVNGDGSVDPSFGDNGTVKLAAPASVAAELPSGKILLVGTGAGGTHVIIAWITVQMLNPDGSVDRGLGKDGTMTLSRTPYTEASEALEIAPTGNGGALVAGSRFLLMLRADGLPNPSFGDDGLVDGVPPVAGARVLADGSVAAVGSTFAGVKDFYALRYTAAGTPVPGFGQDGIRSFDFGGEEEARVASWSADGSVVVGGSARLPGTCFDSPADCEEVPILVAFDPGGGLEAGFGNGGVLRLASLAGHADSYYGSGVRALARRSDGSIIAAGSSLPLRTTAFLAAISPQGTLLPDFGEGGIVRARKPVPARQTVAGFAPQADGGLLAAGTTDAGIEAAPVLIRYAADGSLDRSFGGGAGYVTADKASFVGGFAVDDSGRALMGLYGYPFSRLVELRAADGAREPSFGSEGAISLPKYVFAEAIGFAAEGAPIVVGTRNLAGDAEPGVVLRFRPNGEPDPGFGRNGRVELRSPGGREMRARALAVGTRGRILVGGVVRQRFAIVRLLPDGKPDPRFGSGGWALTGVGRALTSRSDTTRSVALARAGSRIYFAGVVRDGEKARVVLLRFRANGQLDPTFGRGGRRIASIPEPAEPKAIVPSRRGVLVVLSRGPRPLLLFGRGGKLLRQPVGHRSRSVTNVRATVSGGRLILGWNAFSQAMRRDVYHLATRSLSGR